MPNFVATGQADSAALERLILGMANASKAWPEDIAAVVRNINPLLPYALKLAEV